MTLKEAIKRLSANGFLFWPSEHQQDREAQQLGIEALKVVKEFRTGRYKTINSPLPGETEE